MNHKDNIFISKHDYQNMIKHEHSIGSTYFDKGFGINRNNYSLEEIIDLSNNLIDDQFEYNFKNKSCAIIGNSPKLLSTEFGDKINQYDVVVRCNHSQTSY